MSYELCINCRICKSADLTDLIDLGEQCLTSIFPKESEPSPMKAPQVLMKCNNHKCGLVQMKHTVAASHLYTDNYGYRSGLNNTMIDHLQGIVSYIENLTHLKEGDIVVDIGANDATLLSKYNAAAVQKIAIDPSGPQFIEYYPKNVELVPEFFSGKIIQKLDITKKVKVVTSISMFYDLPDPLQFAQDVCDALDELDGIWVMEQSYMPTMIKNLSFDTICHEHLEYYTLKQIDYIAECVGLKVIDMTTNDCNGGSFRVTLSHKNSKYSCNELNVAMYRLKESQEAWDTVAPYKKFEKDFKLQGETLVRFLKHQRHFQKKIAIYGASTKGNTFLQYFGIDNTMIGVVAERNPRKFGHKTPGTEIPIRSEKDVRDAKPDIMLVLPWHFKKEFLVRESEFLDNGGTFIFPLPHFEIVTRKQKPMMIIGGSGQIGNHMCFIQDHQTLIYNISRNPNIIKSNVTNIPCNITDHATLDCLIRAIKPAIIINFASITDSNESIEKPVETIELNGICVTKILETIRSIDCNIKFFNAGSTEMFRGLEHDDVINEESLDKIRPTTPYAIGKTLAFWSVKQYREQYGIYAITGILSNVESHIRRDSYVTKKIINYFKTGDFTKPLLLGNPLHTCDWMHALDVCTSIHSIMGKPIASDYMISSGKLHTIAEFVTEVARYYKIDCHWTDDYKEMLLKKDTTPIVCAYQNHLIRGFEKQRRIRYDNSKLKSVYTHLVDRDLTNLVNYLITNINQDPLIYLCSGRLGDFIHCLWVIKRIFDITGKKGKVLLTETYGGDIFGNGLENTFNELESIVTNQPYIDSFEFHDNLYENKIVNINLNLWRKLEGEGLHWFNKLSKTYNLNWQPTSGVIEKWIDVGKTNEMFNTFHDIVVVHQSLVPTRINPSFPWNEILQNNKCIFVTCNKNEYDQFSHKHLVNCHLAHDLDEMFSIINSCKFFCGNQSSPLAIAVALGKPVYCQFGNVHDRKSYIDLGPNVMYEDKIPSSDMLAFSKSQPQSSIL